MHTQEVLKKASTAARPLLNSCSCTNSSLWTNQETQTTAPHQIRIHTEQKSKRLTAKKVGQKKEKTSHPPNLTFQKSKRQKEFQQEVAAKKVPCKKKRWIPSIHWSKLKNTFLKKSRFPKQTVFWGKWHLKWPTSQKWRRRQGSTNLDFAVLFQLQCSWPIGQSKKTGL